MTLTRIRSFLFMLTALILAAGGGWWAGQREISLKWERLKPEVTVVNKAVPPDRKDVDFSLFWEVWNRLETAYLDDGAIDQEKMVYGAISGMTAAIGDPYTVFLPPVKQEESKADLAGEFQGVGIQLGYKNERLAVIAPLDGTPAKEAGVEAGDIILHIKDEQKNIDVDTDGMTLPQAVEIIRGPQGKPVTLTLLRGWNDVNSAPPTEPFEVTMRRDTITVKSVTVEFITNIAQVLGQSDNSGNSSVAYVRLSRFGDRTIFEWNDVVDQIVKQANKQDQPLAGVVLDLRNNPGGYLDAAVAIASEFFTDGTVVEQKGKQESRPYRVTRPGKLATVPLVVLINQGSASASEIVSGAIQARQRGKLVGTNSFGKGTVQDALELRGGAGLHVTTARWLLPNGNWIHDEGLKPDAQVEYDREASEGEQYDNQVQEAIKLLTAD